MELDSRLKDLLATPGIQLGAPPPEITPEMMRAASRDTLPKLPAVAIHEVSEITFAGPGGDLRMRLYRPAPDNQAPVIVFFHGGGFVLGDLDSHDSLCRSLANLSDCAVAAVEYRLAPEARFPEPLEDCYAAVVEIANHSQGFGVDASRLAVCGDSAGATLATAVTMLARDRGGPSIRHQALFYPATDAACDSASMHELAEGYWLSRELMQWFWATYLRHGTDAANGLASPLCASNLAGLPPTSIVTAGFDPLRDEGEAYAELLRAAGVEVNIKRYGEMIHGFLHLPCVAEVAERAMLEAAQNLRRALDR